jgi:hypothetical protein
MADQKCPHCHLSFVMPSLRNAELLVCAVCGFVAKAEAFEEAEVEVGT